MALSSGAKLGPYIIESTAGAGGMGEVYKAKDSRLDRTVAIKVLSVQVAGNQDLRLRFEREAKAISSLNHPNICTLFDIGHQDGVDYLVMEYLEGETLASRLLRGPLSVPDLLNIAVQIADGLDKAHRQGLIHRDLKPGNIMLTKSGAKLLDFGLAKLQESGGLVHGQSGITRTTTPLTGEGAIIGTLQYMAPEQLEGKEVDARTDIFAFGAILYEMATGRRAFDGGSQASLIASIIKEQPRAIAELQPMSPPMLERVIRQCLEKDPDHRWHTAGDLKRSLLWINEGGSQVGVPLQVSVRRKSRERMLWAATGVLGLAALALGAKILLQAKPELRVARFSITQEPRYSGTTWPMISPDGKYVAFQAQDSARVFKIWVRPMNSLQAIPLEGTDGANRPFWSPDSKFLAFFDNRNQLRRIPATGGPTLLICEAPHASDGTWGSDGIIIFDGNAADSLRQVPAAGGPVTQASFINRAVGETGHAWPWFLPDGKHYLFNTFASIPGTGQQSYLMSGTLGSRESKKLATVESRVVYSTAGYILYMKDRILVAQPFNADKQEITGDPIPLTNEVTSLDERALFSVSNDGQLLYQRGTAISERRMVWVDRTGKELSEEMPPSGFENVALSPDGKRIAYELTSNNGNQTDIWVRDLQRQISSRLTFNEAADVWPVWSADNSRVYFGSDRKDNLGKWSIFSRLANGTGSDEELPRSDSTPFITQSAYPDGSALVVMSVPITRVFDIWKLELRSGKMEPLLNSEFSERWASISPNSQYIAYSSNESGRAQVYIQQLGAGGGKWQITSVNTRMAQWRADGRELYCVSADGNLMATPISYEGGLQIGQPTVLFRKPFYFDITYTNSSYQVTRDGQRFLCVTQPEQNSSVELILVQNWAEELVGR